MTEMPKLPTAFADVMLAQEIRAFVRQHKSPIDFVMSPLSDRRVLNAVLNAPVRLPGLNEAEWDAVCACARENLHP